MILPHLKFQRHLLSPTSCSVFQKDFNLSNGDSNCTCLPELLGKVRSSRIISKSKLVQSLARESKEFKIENLGSFAKAMSGRYIMEFHGFS